MANGAGVLRIRQNPKPVSPNWLLLDSTPGELCAEQLTANGTTSLWMGMESQLHAPSTSSYQGKGAAFGQINPLLRSLLKSRLFSWETIYPLINRAKLRSALSQVPRQIFIILQEKRDHHPIAANRWNNFKTHPTWCQFEGLSRSTSCSTGSANPQWLSEANNALIHQWSII